MTGHTDPLEVHLAQYSAAWRAHDQDRCTQILDQLSSSERGELLTRLADDLGEAHFSDHAIRAELVANGAPDYLIAALADADEQRLGADEAATRLRDLNINQASETLAAAVPDLQGVDLHRITRLVRRISSGAHPLRWCSDEVIHVIASAASTTLDQLQALARIQPVQRPTAGLARNTDSAQVRLSAVSELEPQLRAHFFRDSD